MNEANKFDSKRRLCPDGSCIGVVGDDGRCKVCGRDAGGGAKSAGVAASGLAAVSAGDAAASAAADDTAFDSASDDDASDSDNSLAADAAEPGAASFDAARRLCSDGSCVGLIGSDGKCNVCGQPASE